MKFTTLVAQLVRLYVEAEVGPSSGYTDEGSGQYHAELCHTFDQVVDELLEEVQALRP